MEQSEKDFRKLLEDSKDDPDFKREKAELEQSAELFDDDWVPCQTDEEIIERYGQEIYDLAKKAAETRNKRIALELKRSKTLWGRFQNWRTHRKELKSVVNFIMHGPSGD